MPDEDAPTREVSIREAVAADVPRIVMLILLGAIRERMTVAEIEVESSDPAHGEAFAEIEASPHNLLFVAEQAGLVIGTFQITLIPGLAARGRLRAKIEAVHVAPEWRGKGVGKVMLRHALAVATERGASMMELTSDKKRLDAHRFYVNLGFAQSHEGFKKQLDD